MAGFYTYKEWVDDFVAAINTPGTYAAVLPGDSPVFKWTNTIGTVTYQTKLYQQYSNIDLTGGYLLILPNRTVIPYGMTGNIVSITFDNYFSPPQVYNPSN